MTKYKCGHETNGIIILDSNELSIAGYLDWKDNLETKEKCFDCYCKENKKELGIAGEK